MLIHNSLLWKFTALLKTLPNPSDSYVWEPWPAHLILFHCILLFHFFCHFPTLSFSCGDDLLICGFPHSPQTSLLFHLWVSFDSTSSILPRWAHIDSLETLPSLLNQFLYPQDICDDPRLIVGNISNHQLIQGRLGHKPMVSAFSCLAVQESHWTKVLHLLWDLTQFQTSCLLQ